MTGTEPDADALHQYKACAYINQPDFPEVQTVRLSQHNGKFTAEVISSEYPQI